MYIVWNCCLPFVKTSLLPSKNDEFHENAHFFFKKMPIVIYKNTMLQIVIYKKINVWEEYTPLDCFETNRTWGPNNGAHVLFVSKRSDQYWQSDFDP